MIRAHGGGAIKAVASGRSLIHSSPEIVQSTPMSDRPTPDVLILCKDLMFSSQLTGAVQRAGLVPQTCLGPKTLADGLKSDKTKVAVIDLECPGISITEIRRAATCRLIGFGPHVHERLLESARSAGFDDVLTRGMIFQQFEALLTQLPE